MKHSNQKKKRPAKKSPKAPKVPNVFGVKSRSRAVQPSPCRRGDLEEGTGFEWMRFAAATEYVTNLRGISIRDLSKQSPFDTASTGTLERWSIEDEWVPRRQRFFQEITAEAEKRLQEKVIRARVNQLAKMEAIAGDMADEILTGELAAKSKEGMVSALVRLLESSENLRGKIAEQVVPTHLGGVEQETMPMTPKLTDAEARAAATAVLHQRRLETRQRVKAGTLGEKKSVKPGLHVVQGDGDA